jgi:hypothetical protein
MVHMRRSISISVSFEISKRVAPVCCYWRLQALSVISAGEP